MSGKIESKQGKHGTSVHGTGLFTHTSPPASWLAAVLTDKSVSFLLKYQSEHCLGCKAPAMLIEITFLVDNEANEYTQLKTVRVVV